MRDRPLASSTVTQGHQQQRLDDGTQGAAHGTHQLVDDDDEEEDVVVVVAQGPRPAAVPAAQEAQWRPH
jgi:hypothetical protein